MRIREKWKIDVDLDLLVNKIKEFFESKNFTVHVRENKGDYDVVVLGRQSNGSRVRIDVEVFKEKDTLYIDLSAGEYGAISKLEGIISLLMGGIITLQRIRSEEALSKLELEFFDYIDRFILEYA